MDTYRTIFEVGPYSPFSSFLSNFSLHTGLTLGALVFAAIAWAVSFKISVRRASKREKVNPRTIRLIGATLAVIFIAFFVDFFLFVSGGWSPELTRLYQSGKCKTAEGVVHVSHEQPYHGHSSGDKFEIDGVRFEVSYFTTGAHYKRTISHGGALREGVQARVWFCEFCSTGTCDTPAIARVDIREAL